MKLKSLILGTLVGTLIMFFWGATEWLNPLMKIPFKKVNNTQKVNTAILENMPENGMYIWTGKPASENRNENREGVYYFMAKNDASFYQPGKFMSIQLVNQIATWFLITYLLLLTQMGRHWQRMKFVMLLALLGGLAYYLPMWNWWGFSTEYTLIRWGNMMVGWFLAGTAISYILRKQFIPSQVSIE